MFHNTYYKLHTTSQSGVTLIEVLLYITILGFVMTAALMSTYQILSGSESLSYKNVTEEEAGFIIAKINWALNDVSLINSPSANGSGGTLSVNKNGVGTLIFTLVGDDVTLNVVKINSDRAVITNLNFEHIQKTGSSTVDSIRVSFTANGKNFETTKFIR